MEHKIVIVLDHGADPAGVDESTVAFREVLRLSRRIEALRLSRRIEVPRGVCLLSGRIEFAVGCGEEVPAVRVARTDSPPVIDSALSDS